METKSEFFPSTVTLGCDLHLQDVISLLLVSFCAYIVTDGGHMNILGEYMSDNLPQERIPVFRSCWDYISIRVVEWAVNDGWAVEEGLGP